MAFAAEWFQDQKNIILLLFLLFFVFSAFNSFFRVQTPFDVKHDRRPRTTVYSNTERSSCSTSPVVSVGPKTCRSTESSCMLITLYSKCGIQGRASPCPGRCRCEGALEYMKRNTADTPAHLAVLFWRRIFMSPGRQMSQIRHCTQGDFSRADPGGGLQGRVKGISTTF